MSVHVIGDDGRAGALDVCGSDEDEARWVGVGGVMVVVFKRAHTNKHINRLARDQNSTYGCEKVRGPKGTLDAQTVDRSDRSDRLVESRGVKP